MLRYALALTGALALTTGITGITGFAAPAMAADAAPKIDNSHLYNGGRPCDTAKPYHLVGAEAEYLQAIGIDRNNGLDRLQFRFVVWPLSDREAKTEIMKWDDGPGRVATAQIPQGVLRDGETYGWRVQVTKGDQTSGWSQRCFFKVDLARPASPTIDVPEMYEGVPAKLRISGNGDPEIVGYEYTLGWNDIPVSGCLWSGELGQLVCSQPNPPLKGESATLDLTLPGGPHILKVRAVDRVGNRSEVASQTIYVNHTSPRIEQVGFAEYGSEVTLKFTPHPALTNVVAHVYTINGGQEQTVAARPDGTATVTVPLNQESIQVLVRSKTGSGHLSSDFGWSAYFGPWPGISSDLYLNTGLPYGGVGVAGSFRFAPPPGGTEVASYRYSVNGGEFQDIAAGTDGRAALAFTPSSTGYHWFEVYAVAPDGTLSDIPGYYDFTVAE